MTLVKEKIEAKWVTTNVMAQLAHVNEIYLRRFAKANPMAEYLDLGNKNSNGRLIGITWLTSAAEQIHRDFRKWNSSQPQVERRRTPATTAAS